MIKTVSFVDKAGFPMSLVVDIPDNLSQVIKVTRLHDDAGMEIDMSKIIAISEPKTEVKQKLKEELKATG